MIKVHDLIYQKELNSNILFKFLVKITVDTSQIITHKSSNQLHKLAQFARSFARSFGKV